MQGLVRGLHVHGRGLPQPHRFGGKDRHSPFTDGEPRLGEEQLDSFPLSRAQRAQV